MDGSLTAKRSFLPLPAFQHIFLLSSSQNGWEAMQKKKKKQLRLQKFETLEMENAEQGEESLHKRPCAVWKMVCPSHDSFFVLELRF